MKLREQIQQAMALIEDQKTTIAELREKLMDNPENRTIRQALETAQSEVKKMEKELMDLRTEFAILKKTAEKPFENEDGIPAPAPAKDAKRGETEPPSNPQKRTWL